MRIALSKNKQVLLLQATYEALVQESCGLLGSPYVASSGRCGAKIRIPGSLCFTVTIYPYYWVEADFGNIGSSFTMPRFRSWDPVSKLYRQICENVRRQVTEKEERERVAAGKIIDEALDVPEPQDLLLEEFTKLEAKQGGSA